MCHNGPEFVMPLVIIASGSLWAAAAMKARVRTAASEAVERVMTFGDVTSNAWGIFG